MQFRFAESFLPDEVSEDEGQDGVAVVVGSVDLLSSLAEPVLQLPEIGGMCDLGGAVLGIADKPGTDGTFTAI
jgi:hypothetical protein